MIIILNCILTYVFIIYVFIPIILLIFSLFMGIYGCFVRLYYFLEDYFTKGSTDGI